MAVDFTSDTTDRDWLPVLDAIHGKGLKAVVGFVTQGTGGPVPFRPVSTNVGWVLGNVQTFLEDARLTGHDALLAFRMISEPWNDALGPTYDTETLKGLYEHLRGEFAFLLYDRSRGRLIAARDRFGIKPLYVARTRAGGWAFSSEVKGLFGTGLVERAIDPGTLELDVAATRAERERRASSPK